MYIYIYIYIYKVAGEAERLPGSIADVDPSAARHLGPLRPVRLPRVSISEGLTQANS